ncbi:MAG: hypothetical protein NTY19_51110 [Planctomycetota bacterium]|nr:hypothetical protein [Planctomycetota bacterium]
MKRPALGGGELPGHGVRRRSPDLAEDQYLPPRSIVGHQKMAVGRATNRGGLGAGVKGDLLWQAFALKYYPATKPSRPVSAISPLVLSPPPVQAVQVAKDLSRGTLLRKAGLERLTLRLMTPHVWIRREFEIGSEPLVMPQLIAHHALGAEVYINGILAAKLTGYTIEYQEYEIRPEARESLKPGRNLLAVHAFHDGNQQLIDVGVVDPVPPHTIKSSASAIDVSHFDPEDRRNRDRLTVHMVEDPM